MSLSERLVAALVLLWACASVAACTPRVWRVEPAKSSSHYPRTWRDEDPKLDAKDEEELERARREDREDREAVVAGVNAAAQVAAEIAKQASTRNGGSASSAATAQSNGSGGEGSCPCRAHAARVRSACANDPQAPGCYCQAAAMHQCFADNPSCGADPAGSRAEAQRMREAAKDIARAGSGFSACAE